MKPPVDINVLDKVTKIMGKKIFGLRRVAWWFAVSLIIDALITVTIGYGLNDIHTVTLQQEKLTCVSGNKVRADEKQLWNYVFVKIEPAHPTVQQRAAFAAFETEVNHVFKLRDCTKLYG